MRYLPRPLTSLRPGTAAAAGIDHDHGDAAPEKTQGFRDFIVVVGETTANECLENRQLVRVVEDDSPADGAGLRQGDLLVEAGGRALATADDLHAVLEGLSTDDTLALKVVRATDDLDVRVSFAAAARSEGSA